MATLTALVLTYNKGWIFPRFMSSLQSQERPPDQVIVIDDASNDCMAYYLPRLPKHWKVVRLPNNRGQSYARNVGMRYVSGDLVIFLDADIVMQRGMLRVLERALERDPGASIAYGHYRRAGSRTQILRARPWDPRQLRRVNFVSTMSLVRRRHLPNPVFDQGLKRYEDWDLWLRMAEAGRRGVFVDYMLFTAHYKPSDLSGAGESGKWYHAVRRKHGL